MDVNEIMHRKAGRPRKLEDPSRAVTFRLPESFIRTLKDVSEREGISMSKVIQTAVTERYVR